MNNLRKHGDPPYSIAVIHGGPGAGGEMAPVARELASEYGILEPIQTRMSIQGQVEELKGILEENGEFPVTLVGYSWGAWLGFIFAAYNPKLIRKLVLISSGPFEVQYAASIGSTRMSRLSGDERSEVEKLLKVLNNTSVEDKSVELAKLGALFSKADAYEAIEQESDQDSEEIDVQVDIFQSLWNEAARMRRSGKLLRFGERIKCPVVAIHGDYDPHPAEGVEEPLSKILDNFRFVLLEDCGHKPWIEVEAKDEFYRILKEEIKL